MVKVKNSSKKFVEKIHRKNSSKKFVKSTSATSKPKNVQKPLIAPSQITEVKQIKEVRRKAT